MLYRYRAVVLSVSDDSVLSLSLDLGFGVYATQRVASPMLRFSTDADGLGRHVAALRRLLPGGRLVEIQTVKHPDVGYLAENLWIDGSTLADCLAALPEESEKVSD